jgi:uncharacterized protein YigE (DUF2233 family)
VPGMRSRARAPRARLRLGRLLLTVAVAAGAVFAVRAAWTRARSAEACQWRQAAPGIEVGDLRLRDPQARVTAVRADPARCELRAVDAHKGLANLGALASEVCPPTGAAINASFFSRDLTPLGLLIVDGKPSNPIHPPDGWGFFVVRRHRAAILPATDRAPAGVAQALQSKPRLVIDGQIPAFRPQSAHRRSAVGIDAEGRVILAATGGRLTLEQWAACLRDRLGCVNALNLDGGPSTQLTVRGRVSAEIAGQCRVPVFATVAPRG